MIYFFISILGILWRCLDFFCYKNCRLIEITAEYCQKSLFLQFCNVVQRHLVGQVKKKFNVKFLRDVVYQKTINTACCISRSFRKIISERSRETWYIIMELLHANFLDLAMCYFTFLQSDFALTCKVEKTYCF